jgi:hypothetical protein
VWVVELEVNRPSSCLSYMLLPELWCITARQEGLGAREHVLLVRRSHGISFHYVNKIH